MKYQELILPKGFVLYYPSDKPFIKESKYNNIIRCVFHPSEREADYIIKIKLKKDISLFFAIDFRLSNIINNSLISIPYCTIKEIVKTDFFKNNIKYFNDSKSMILSMFKEQKCNGIIDMQMPYDGQLHIHLINNSNIFDFEIEPINIDWKREGTIKNNGLIIQKKWGNNYPILFDKSIILTVNELYKYLIELFLENIKHRKYKFNTSLQLLLRDCQIKYYEDEIL
jgi:hypothetical protein